MARAPFAVAALREGKRKRSYAHFGLQVLLAKFNSPPLPALGVAAQEELILI